MPDTRAYALCSCVLHKVLHAVLQLRRQGGTSGCTAPEVRLHVTLHVCLQTPIGGCRVPEAAACFACRRLIQVMDAHSP
jgi:hypothetical protein